MGFVDTVNGGVGITADAVLSASFISFILSMCNVLKYIEQ